MREDDTTYVDVGMSLSDWRRAGRRTFSEIDRGLDRMWPQYSVRSLGDRAGDACADLADALMGHPVFGDLAEGEQAQVARAAAQLLGADWDLSEARAGAPLAPDEIASLAVALSRRVSSGDVRSREELATAMVDVAGQAGIDVTECHLAGMAARVFADRPLHRLTGPEIDSATRDYVTGADRTLLERWYRELSSGLPNQDWEYHQALPDAAGEGLFAFAEPQMAARLPDSFLRKIKGMPKADSARAALAYFGEDVLRAFQVKAFEARRSGVDITGLNFETLMVEALKECKYRAVQSDDKTDPADIYFVKPGWDKPVALQLKTTIEKKTGIAMKHYTDVTSELDKRLTKFDAAEWVNRDRAGRESLLGDSAIAKLVASTVGAHMEKYDGLIHMSDPEREGDHSNCAFTSVDNGAIASRLKAILRDVEKLRMSGARVKFVRNKNTVGIDYADGASGFSIRVGVVGKEYGKSRVSVDGPGFSNEIASVAVPFAAQSHEQEQRGTPESLMEGIAGADSAAAHDDAAMSFGP